MSKPAITEFLKTFTEYADLYIGIVKKNYYKSLISFVRMVPIMLLSTPYTPLPTHTPTPNQSSINSIGFLSLLAVLPTPRQHLRD
jgi:hypothetical protein